MTTAIRYVFEYAPHPWDDKMRRDGIKAWCIVRIVEQTTVRAGHSYRRTIDRTPIALFHFDSTAEALQEAINAGQGIEVDPDLKGLWNR